MSRTARVKSPQLFHHIMSRSVSEIKLFRDSDDKLNFLKLLKKYSELFKFRVLGFCLMDNHYHVHLDPAGGDISKFMLCLNLAYAVYYNKRHKRHGHVFQGRFESRAIDNDQYNLTVSAYIHNNAKDMKNYRDRIHEYPFSSFGIYIGKQPDDLGLVDTSYVLGCFREDKATAQKRYFKFVCSMNKNKIQTTSGYEQSEQPKQPNILNLEDFKSNEYRNERKILWRNLQPENIVSQIANEFSVVGLTVPVSDVQSVRSRYDRELSEFRAVCVYCMRVLCNFSYKQICVFVGNMSISGVSRLCRIGADIIKQDRRTANIVNLLIDSAEAA